MLSFFFIFADDQYAERSGNRNSYYYCNGRTNACQFKRIGAAFMLEAVRIVLTESEA
jgi:hypothetical protein